ncbi:LOW QUALITY PROTEIN: uncharacterized protein LOC110226165 [Arabidopsis lyrata subsp. lyrata]|uniref:LOW QUALITY PROTEIN: uncharacterized protein LOC110226165 n=1 Tax=Arabidopsis lyrata subsp. lyrata TaxID=81972 RepID=UPI000A29DCF8|nr:LOW QUALITY PROTEIN: uncharacterized protein LOC110226165 [Arabidopsis lyrata subsp. lyrata]|eukprot:XP_020872514.1 LOW QUALITY PROTEIN: uncharacterized protein LOC110226165 [Arabidopsis lyrata subsp. lyrata]
MTKRKVRYLGSLRKKKERGEEKGINEREEESIFGFIREAGPPSIIFSQRLTAMTAHLALAVLFLSSSPPHRLLVRRFFSFFLSLDLCFWTL